jgi:DNA-binding CsgD family transcriptional regulator
LGFLELSLSNHEQAHAHLRPVVEFLDRMGSAEPGIIPCIPDDIEALVSLGRLDEAQVLVDRLERQGLALDRPWALATAARCRGLLAAARGELGNAQVALERAIDEHQRVPQPFELARSLLVAGQIQRRAKQKRPARTSLEQARNIFAELGAGLWTGRAETELARIGGRPPAPLELTPTEEQIARLAAEGRTNREIADALFVSASTVQSALKHIYLKLGVRSRTELARRFDA